MSFVERGVPQCCARVWWVTSQTNPFLHASDRLTAAGAEGRGWRRGVCVCVGRTANRKTNEQMKAMQRARIATSVVKVVFVSGWRAARQTSHECSHKRQTRSMHGTDRGWV